MLRKLGKLGTGILFLIAVGLCTYGVGGIIVTKEEFEQDIDEVKHIAQGSIIVVDRQISSSAESDLVDAVESLDSDMEVETVETYVNVLEIPQYGVLAYIYPDVSTRSLKKGVGHYPGTVGLGELGNCVIAGHSSATLNCILNPVKDMKIMDTFFVYDAEGVQHKYYITDRYAVDSSSLFVLDTVDDTISQCTILTCTRGGKQRLILEGKEFTDEQANLFMETQNNTVVEEMLSINEQIEVQDYVKLLMNRGSLQAVPHWFNKIDDSMMGEAIMGRIKFAGYLKEVFGDDVSEN